MSQVISKLEVERRKENTKMISDLMKAEKVRGNPKDYVVLAGYRLIDWSGEFDLHSQADGGTVGVEGIALLHKSRLEPVLGAELADHFWSRKLRRRRAPR